jgi:serine/threonine protein kinase
MSNSTYLLDVRYALKLLNPTITDCTVCDIENAFDNIKVLPKNSISSTSQLIVSDTAGNHQFLKNHLNKRKQLGLSPQVFIKYMPDLNTSIENRMYIEAAIYRHLQDKLLKPHVTPHIMNFVASIHCTNIEKVFDLVVKNGESINGSPSIPEDVLEGWGHAYDMSDADTYSIIKNKNVKSVMLILELGTGMSLMDLIRNKLLKPDDLKPILFQVGYTLLQMNRVGVRHNDLHLGNVWIDILPQEKIIYYKLRNGSMATIKSKYMPKIYDFDLSTFTADYNNNENLVMDNVAIEDKFCKLYGMCSQTDYLYDWLTFAYNLILYINKNMKLKERIEANDILMLLEMDPDFEQGVYSNFEGRYCKHNVQEYCEKNGVVPESMIKSFDQLVKDGFFPFVSKTSKRVYKNQLYTSL